MKVPPKRKGKLAVAANSQVRAALNESPSEKEGKFAQRLRETVAALNESPSEKEGKRLHQTNTRFNKD